MGNLQAFFTSTKGQLLIVLVILILFGIILFFGKNKKMDAKVLSISALLVALSTALSYVVLFKAPYGGSVTLFSILPIVLAGYFFNVRIGLIVGMAVGFLNLLLNPYIVHPIQLLLDYPLAFGALGLGGILKKRGEYSIIGVLWISILARYFCAFLSGVVFFGAYAPKGTAYRKLFLITYTLHLSMKNASKVEYESTFEAFFLFQYFFNYCISSRKSLFGKRLSHLISVLCI